MAYYSIHSYVVVHTVQYALEIRINRNRTVNVY